jgi:hypothetical protein
MKREVNEGVAGGVAEGVAEGVESRRVSHGRL